MARATKKSNDLVSLEPKKDQFMGFWFQDSIEFVPGCTLNVKIKDFLCRTRSKFQDIWVVETEGLGRMLVIDGVTMLTEFDEFAYHEMISHVPLLVHPKPSRVLVIGGGDGGVVREVLKHPEVESVHLCEIDEEVVNVCRKYLPSQAGSLGDPRVKIFYEDGAKFAVNHPKSYEVIIVDSTDPFGPGQVLFQRPFFLSVKKALTHQGIAVTQCESIYLHRPVIEGVFSFARKLFPVTSYYVTIVPTYPSGMIGFSFCSLDWDPLRDIAEARAKRLKNLRYYSPEIHRGAFALPRFAEGFIGGGGAQQPHRSRAKGRSQLLQP
jgi:spermidine synthase